jgi:hypothetical protein
MPTASHASPTNILNSVITMPESLIAQSLQLSFQCLDMLVALLERSGNVGGLESLRDMLRTIRVPGENLEQDCLLSPRLVSLGHQHLRQLGVTFHDARSPRS